MGERGPTRKPTAVRIAEGSLTAEYRNDLEPTPTVGVPEKPEHLGEVASKEWDRIVPILMDMHVLTVADGSALAAYCKAYERWIEAEALLANGEFVVDSPQGPKPNPACNVSWTAVEQMRKFMAEFGMTPASRTRITIQGGKKKKDADDPGEKPKPILKVSKVG